MTLQYQFQEERKQMRKIGLRKNPFQLDSKAPDWSKFQEFLNGKVRYTSLKKTFPAEADELFTALEENAKWRHNSYIRMAAMNYTNNKE